MSNMGIGRVSKIIEQHDDLVLNSNQPFGLMNFTDAVSKAIPGCRITPESNQWSWVYMPDDHYAMGMIGFGDFRDSGEETLMYTVKSRNIANGKYNDYSRQHHMTMSIKLETAVKNARAYLRRYTPRETMELTYKWLRYALRDEVDKLRTETFRAMNHAFGVTRPDNRITMEMRRLLDTEHSFLDPTHADDLRAAFAAEAAYKEIQEPLNMSFVQVLPYRDTQRLDLAHLDNCERYTPDYDGVHSYTGADIETEVSEDIRGKVAVLDMLEEETYLAGVGYKVMTGLYYVAR